MVEQTFFIEMYSGNQSSTIGYNGKLDSGSHTKDGEDGILAACCIFIGERLAAPPSWAQYLTGMFANRDSNRHEG